VEFELNSTLIHTNTHGLKWIRQHPNKASSDKLSGSNNQSSFFFMSSWYPIGSTLRVEYPTDLNLSSHSCQVPCTRVVWTERPCSTNLATSPGRSPCFHGTRHYGDMPCLRKVVVYLAWHARTYEAPTHPVFKTSKTPVARNATGEGDCDWPNSWSSWHGSRAHARFRVTIRLAKKCGRKYYLNLF